MTRKQSIILYCKKEFHSDVSKDNLFICCHCGRHGVSSQEGDGKVIHSLCYKCEEKLK